MWLGPVGARLSLRLRNFPLNQTGLALYAIISTMTPVNSCCLSRQGISIMHRLSMKYEGSDCPTVGRKPVARKLSRAQIQWVTTSHFISFFKVKNKWTPDIKYYKLLTIIHFTSAVWSFTHSLWSSPPGLKCWHLKWANVLASYYLLSGTHRRLPHTADWTSAATFNLFSCASQWCRMN